MRSRLLSALAIAAAAAGLSACGEEEPTLRAENEGSYIEVGELKYQVQLSRQLNPGLRSDAELLTGLAADEEQLEPDTTWFVVYMRVENETEESHESSEEFTIEDTAGEEFEPIPVDNIMAYRPQLVEGGRQVPDSQVVANFGGAQGSILLFKLPVSALDNRPLELLVQSPDGRTTGTVDLDV
jgi:hypothetical protein